MKSSALLKPGTVKINRSQFRQKQSAVLKRARGRTVVVVTSRGEGGQKCVLDREYFEEIMEKFRNAMETLEIMSDTKLFTRLLRTARTLDDDVRLGRLRSLEEAFGQE